jgi:hypothetical protein
MQPQGRAAALSIALVVLAACGGGGGGSSGPSFVEQPFASSAAAGGASTDVPFTSFAAVNVNQAVAMDGVAVTASGTHTVAPNDDVTIKSVNINDFGSGSARLTYDASGSVKALSISTPQSSATFDRDTPEHELGCKGPVCAGRTPSAAILAANPSEFGWNYQTFGVWAVEAGPETWTAGAMSVGAPTPGNALPTTGQFTFEGATSGAFVNSAGTPFSTAAQVRADVNFETRNIAFSTSRTTTVNLNNGKPDFDADSLNVSGTFSYAPGVNAFSGSLSAVNGMTGQGSGRFYGPAAQEMGGVYRLQGQAGSMIGGFGAKRP